MKPFRFRAEAALELRRRQEEDAQHARAAAQRALEAAERALVQTRDAIDQAMRDSRDADLAHAAAHEREWRRNWIASLQCEAAARREAAAARRAEAHVATERAIAAHKRVRSLELYRARALREWQAVQRREEQRAFDELATIRFTRRGRRAGGGR
jgi:flagellar export protein FliJ